MMRSQSGGVRFKNIIIIIEKDKAHYPETKMQGTGIKMYTVRTTLDLTHIKEVKDGKVGNKKRASSNLVTAIFIKHKGRVLLPL